MRFVRLGRRKNIFIGFLLSYLVVFSIPMAIGLFVYNQTMNVITIDAHRNNVTKLRQVQETIDSRLKEIENLTRILPLYSNTYNAMDLESAYDVGAIRFLGELRENLSSFCQINSFINTIYVYFKKGNFVLSPYSSTNADMFFSSTFKYDGYSKEEFVKTFLDVYSSRKMLPIEQVTLNGYERNLITYIQTLPTDSYKPVEGAIIILIEKNKIDEMLFDLSENGEGWVYITDAEGKFISQNKSHDGIELPLAFDSRNGNYEIINNGANMIVSHQTSDYNGWTYVSVLPYSVTMRQVERLRFNILLLFAGAFCLSIIVSFFLSYRNVKPIRQLIDRIKHVVITNQKKGANEYEFLDSSFTTIIEDNMTLNDRMASYLPYMRNTFLYRLLNGGFTNADEITVFLDYLGLRHLNSHDCKFLVAVIKITGFNNEFSDEILHALTHEKDVVRDVIYGKINDGCYVVDIGYDKIAVLHTFTAASVQQYKSETEAVARDLHNTLLQKYKIRTVYAFGTFIESIMEVNASYANAEQSLEHMAGDAVCVTFWFDDIPVTSASYLFTLDMESKLINIVKTGNETELSKMFKSLYEENSLKRKISVKMTKRLMYELCGAGIKLISIIEPKDLETVRGIKALLDGVPALHSIDEMYKSMEQAFLHMIDIVKTQQDNQNNDLKNKMVEYVMSCYNNNQLSISMVSDEFNISESFIGIFFKKRFNQTFSDYIEQLRMDKSCELLIKTNMTVEEISQSIGYNSAHSYRRAFKRLKGVSPAAYKAEHTGS